MHNNIYESEKSLQVTLHWNLTNITKCLLLMEFVVWKYRPVLEYNTYMPIVWGEIYVAQVFLLIKKNFLPVDFCLIGSNLWLLLRVNDDADRANWYLGMKGYYFHSLSISHLLLPN